MTRLTLEDVGFVYPDGTRALEAVDLDIRSGDAVAIVGQNGSGKSTLVRLLDGLLRPTAGRVLYDGSDTAMWSTAEMAAVVGLAFQDPDRQIFGRRLRDEVAFGPRILGRSPADVASAVSEALTVVGLDGLADANPYDIGSSRRKLLALASVYAAGTPVLALDEPTTGQDARGMRLVGGLIAAARARGATVIAISHDMRFVAETFPRVVVMRAGRIVLDGPPSEVFAEAVWPMLASAALEPPLAATLGARLGLGSTPTERAVIDALVARRDP